MFLTATAFGMKLEVVLIFLFILIIILGLALVYTYSELVKINRKYYSVMSGKRGRDLEKIILTRFKEMDLVKSNAKKVTREVRRFKGHLDSSISKIGLIKYNAFDNMAGELSFSLALLNEFNSGVVLNVIHSNDGCRVYAKEIIKGESYIVLTEEEKDALSKALTVDDEIKKMSDTDPEEIKALFNID